jgi:hypothetical protein
MNDETDFQDDLPEGGEVESSSSEAADYYLRDLTEDDVYSRLSGMKEIPNHLSALESRFSGNLSKFSDRVAGIEKSLGARTNFSPDKLKAALEGYDPKLAEVLIPALQESLQTQSLDEAAFRPYIDPVRSELQEWMGEQLVMSAYSPEALAEIVPPIQDGRLAPQGKRHEDFVEWYSQQGYATQQALVSFGAPYVNALRAFERWEQAKNKDREQAAAGKSARLANGQMPTGLRGRPTGGRKQMSPEETFLAGFEEAHNEVSR